MQTNGNNCIEKIQSKTRAMWVAGTVRVSHCDHNSFSGTAEYMGVIHTKSSKACCSVFFFLLWPGLAFERCPHICHFRQGMSWCSSVLLFTVTNQTFQLESRLWPIQGWMFTAGSKSIADNILCISKSFVFQTSPSRLKVANCNNPT